MSIKIKTQRCWDLQTKVSKDCFEIAELHQGDDDDQLPYVVIPLEAVDEVVYQLLRFKRINDKKWGHGE